MGEKCSLGENAKKLSGELFVFQVLKSKGRFCTIETSFVTFCEIGVTEQKKSMTWTYLTYSAANYGIIAVLVAIVLVFVLLIFCRSDRG